MDEYSHPAAKEGTEEACQVSSWRNPKFSYSKET